MIRNILDVLPHVKGETESIRIAKGKYLLPTTLKKAFKQIKQEYRWHK